MPHLDICMKTFNLIPEVFFFLSSFPYYFWDSCFDAQLHFFMFWFMDMKREEKKLSKKI